MALERTVIRWLYGRPLETLLATWGISLMLMQGLDVGRDHGAGRPGADLQPPGDHRLRILRRVPGVGAVEPHAAGSLRTGHHAEPAHGRLRGRADRARGHAGLRAGFGHRGTGRRGPVAAG
ncbi:hypothetical protein G6F22_020086 [Rhizopus arrhizus]|nr:hypothetical protein G6F22_020086 [Rhizopus arrhizus]